MSTAKNCYSGTGEKKSSFVMTCNRLSSFLKDKRCVAGFDLKGKPEVSSPATETNRTTVDLLSNMELPVHTSEKTEKSVNRLPQYVSLDSFCKMDDSTNKSATECKTAQMTIFYRGQILVFDHVSAVKARDMMQAVTGASSSHDDDNQIRNQIQPASTSDSHYERFGSQDQILRGLQVNGSDLPIARRSSLHKFLAKRKDRANERSPYQLHNRLKTPAFFNHKFDLNL